MTASLRRSAAAPFLSGHHDHTSHQPHICLCPVFKVKDKIRPPAICAYWSSLPHCTCGVQYCRGVLGVLSTPTTLADPTACSHDLTRPSNLATLGTVEQCTGVLKHRDPPPAKQLYSVPRGSRMTMRIFKSLPKTGCGIKCFAERKLNTVYFKETHYYPKKIFTLNFDQTIYICMKRFLAASNSKGF